ncbi:GcvT family protein [Hyphomicrobium facile]|uniref:4-methylaminobutanoate oxidase (Formaldehyde-forming) n=1 Tax=Hyphomicrobium facile TaxID=51670 RepID=A0A1I7N596_9HYPH|nr:FAD-dependent oxidoreductase [Hyphomicrobium facile]SFV29746.1 4-methylaminobutanoate oxidase (formaldehyde-forming) [Hyphomicrobium facile]
MTSNLPKEAHIVIIGGGIVGCSVAYHLAKLGQKDVVLLERNKLTSGSTWHAAGAIGQLRSSSNITRLLGYSVELYDRLEAETGQATGWVKNGSLRLARTKERRAEFERAATTARSFGLQFDIITPAEAKEIVPQIDITGLDCAGFVPSDGVGNPSDITMALAKGARQGGVRIFEDVVVTAVETDNGSVEAVVTNRGRIACDIVVNCGGIWAPELGRMAGVNVPLQPAYHQYFVTEQIEGLRRHMPTIRDTDYQTYFKEDVGGLQVGGYEFNPIPFDVPRIPDGHEFKLMEPDVDHFEPLLENAMRLVPALRNVGVKTWFNGIESFTEDGMFILGEAPEVRNYFVGAGFNAFGIAAGGGAGRALAEWIVEGEPAFDMWAVDIRRFGKHHRSRRTVMARSLEGQAAHYAMGWPHLETNAARPLRRSPLYDRLKGEGCSFGAKYGWERPNWFAPAGVEPVDVYSFDHQNWRPYVAEEHHAARNNAAIFDQTSFAKFIIEGPDAEAELQRICANDVAKPVGSLIYTQMLNRRGGIEADVTISRLGENRFYMVTGTGFANHDADHLLRHITPGARLSVQDVTSAYACLSVMGPAARNILQPLAEADLSNTAFPFATCQQIFIAGAPVIAARVTFVGELGWELHVPTEYALTLYDAIKAAGASYGIRDAGYRTIDSLRLEKTYRVWSADIGPDYTPYEAGLGFAVRLKKAVDFIGREALLKAKERPLTKRLVAFSVDPEIVLLGRETIYRDGERIGWLTSGGSGHTVGRSIGLGYLRSDKGLDDAILKSANNYELEVRTRRVPATLHLEPLYDAPGVKVRS